MIETVVGNSGETVEESLRAELAQSEACNAGAVTILRYLLAYDGRHLFGDETLARIRGMQQHIAQQLLTASGMVSSDYPQIINNLWDNSQLLSHLHALALEGQITSSLERSFSIDPVVPPLLQELASSAKAELQNLARQFIASQMRWCQSLQRMQIELLELPIELFEDALAVLRELGGREPKVAEFRLRERYDEASSRLGLAARLVLQMDNHAFEALDLRHGGVALFTTALSLGSEQSREQALFAMQNPQTIKLALGLRAAGLDLVTIQRQLLILHDDGELPKGLEQISAANASMFFIPDPDQGH